MLPDYLELVLNAYRDGAFPMAEDADDEDFAFYKPHLRALLPIESLHVPKKLAKTIRNTPHRVTINAAFETIITACGTKKHTRPDTWINTPITQIFIALHKHGHAHSIEVWDKHGDLMGGLYGLSIGRVFCGESMVSLQTDGSKIALIHLCSILKSAGYNFLDSQFANDHLRQFGLYEIPQAEYEAQIETTMNESPLHKMTDISIGRDLVLDYLDSLKQTA